MSEPLVSLITPTLDGKHHLEVFLESVDRLDYPRDRFEVIVVDNGSTDGSLELIRRDFPHVRMIENRANAGFARSNNQGAEIARGTYLALLNNDTRLEPTWLRAMVERAETAPADTVCFASLILDWDGATVDFIDAAMAFTGVGFHERRGVPASSPEGRDYPDELLFASGAAMLVSRQAYLEVGGFDDDYFNYYEDVDLGWRLWTLGYRVGFCGEAVAYHRRNASIGARHETTRLLERNALFSVIKNYEDETLSVVLPAALLLASQRAAARARRSQHPSRARTLLRMLRREAASGEFAKASPEAWATLAALEEVGVELPALIRKRRSIQAARRRSDAEIVPLFRTPLRVGKWPPDEGTESAELSLLRALGVVGYFERLAEPAPVDVR